MKLKSIIKMLVLSPLFFSSALMAQNESKETGTNIDTLVVEDLNQVVNIAFGQSEKSKVIGSFSSVRPSERITYDNTQWVRDYIDGLLLGVRGSGNIRGFGDEALFVIDGIPGRDINMLITSEIEEITVLKDVNGIALYGSQGRNGVVLITTKRGKANQKHFALNLNYGLSKAVALPKYLRAGEYMETYNEARRNDGLENFYDSDLIEKTKSGINPYRYPDVDFYNSEYLRNFTSNANLATEFSGGSDKVQYYVNLAYKFDDNMVKLNPSVNKGSNTFKVRGNIDFKVNEYIKSGVDVVTYLNTQKTAHTNIMDAGTNFLPHWYAPLLPVSMIDPEYLEQTKNIRQFDGFILGGDNRYKGTTPFADVYAKGYNRFENKNVQVGNTIDFDLRKITKGLSAKTYLSLDYYDAAKVSINNDFNFYQPTWNPSGNGNDTIIALTPLGKPDKKDLTENVSTNDYRIRYGFSAQVDYNRTFADNHHLAATLMGFSNSIQNKGVKQLDVMSHAGLRLNYDYKNKYYVSLTGTQVYSIKLPDNTKNGFSPSIGLAYVISNEDFMRDIEWVNFLKFKFTSGTLKSDLKIGDYYLYQDIFNPNASSFSWNDGARTHQLVNSTRGGNYNLGYEERKELSFGFQSQLFQALWLEGAIFRNDLTGQVARLTNTVYPSFYGNFIPYDNYNENRYEGFEVGAKYFTRLGNLNLAVGTNLLYTETEALKRDEVYKYDYQYHQGHPINAIFGLQAAGLYTNDDFDANGNLVEGLPKPQFGVVRPGDIKYLDQNNDKKIDNNDEFEIGRWDQPLNYSLNLKLNYRNVTLFVVADGQSGGEAILSDKYYQSRGTDKYSEFIRNRWTAENPNPNAIVPRITTGTGTNNFKTSTYWMYDNSYFRINRAQLTYEFDKNLLKKIGLNNLSIDVAGSNLFQFAKNKDYKELSIGAWPQKRYYTVGLRMTL